MTAAAFDSVEKVYRTHFLSKKVQPAVVGVSLEIPRGSVFGLLGPNRAGKTTLIKLLLSLSKPTSGKVTRLGEPISKRHTLARIGYMHENHAFPRYLTATEVLHGYGGLSGVRSEDLASKAEALLQRVGLADRKHEPILRFSKGMVQRLGLAQALINDPDLLILDEPTEGLDLIGRQLMREVVREFKAQSKTVILVSHVLTEVEELCDELAVLVAGELVYRGTTKQLTQNGTKTMEAALKEQYTKGASS